ncbi:MAG: hypothetical protein K8R90_11700 [Candidatus Cloacimonetes bacterium]|nr:hypothetical protein [Candidatus Cloacimonadota bacterium]
MKNLWILLPFVLLAACGPPDAPVPEDVIASVNDEVLTRSEVVSLLPAGEWDAMPVADKQLWVEDWKRLALLSQLAQEEGIDQEPAAQSALANGRRKILANMLLSRRLQQLEPAEDTFETQMHEYYQTQYEKTRFEFDIQRLTIHDEELAQVAWNELQSGASFYDVYQRHVSDGIAYQRGAVSREMLPAGLYDALVEAARFEAVRAADDGRYDLARYTSRRKIDLGFDHPNARSEIRRRLELQREQELVKRLILEREATAEIVIEL